MAVTPHPNLTPFHVAPAMKHFVSLTVPGYSLQSLATAVDSQRMDNRAAQRKAMGERRPAMTANPWGPDDIAGIRLSCTSDHHYFCIIFHS